MDVFHGWTWCDAVSGTVGEGEDVLGWYFFGCVGFGPEWVSVGDFLVFFSGFGGV